jgi:CDP-paratose 2-epimerase
MRIFIAGICGFVGASLARRFQAQLEGARIFGIDSLSRPGAEINRGSLASEGIEVLHGDVRVPSDLEGLAAADWVIDAAANPSVLAGVDGKSSARQLIEHNLYGTLNLLEYARRHGSGFMLLSSSRVYSIPPLSALPMRREGAALTLDTSKPISAGVSVEGIAEEFSTAAPISLYGSTKLASEAVALEYGCTFGFPVWINRCGVLAGAGQFGLASQGIFSYWMNAHLARRPLRYTGFGGLGLQVRDAFHPHDLAACLMLQMRDGAAGGERLFNLGGGAANSLSLAQLTADCDARFGPHAPASDPTERPFDLPWIVMDSSRARARFGWKIERPIASILDEIAEHARAHPEWLALSEGRRG